MQSSMRTELGLDFGGAWP